MEEFLILEMGFVFYLCMDEACSDKKKITHHSLAANTSELECECRLVLLVLVSVGHVHKLNDQQGNQNENLRQFFCSVSRINSCMLK